MTSVHADPYWKWAEATDYAYTGIADRTGSWWVQILVELELSDDQRNPADALHAYLQTSPTRGFVPKPYRKKGVQYCTAWVARDDITNLPFDIVRRFKLGLAANTSDKSINLFSEINKEWNGSLSLFKDKACVLAIIDDHVNCEHPAFKDSKGKSRIQLTWDQSGNAATSPHTFNKPNYGYARLLGDMRPWSTANNKIRASHGTHVAGLAGGSVTPGFRLHKSSPHLFANSPATDAASDAPMAVVMLPNSTVADTSGGALGVNVLDALTFFLDNIATETHLLVNLSFGTMSGAHDGTGVLESAIENLITKRPDKLTMVLPSGNSFESQCHAQFSLDAKATSALTWRVLPDDKTCSFLELWLPADASVSVTVQSPGCHQTLSVAPLIEDALLKVGTSVVAGIWRDRSATASQKKRILIAMAPTCTGTGQPGAVHGDWTVTVTNSGDKTIQFVQVWVERDNASFGQRLRGRQSYLVNAASLRHRVQLAPTLLAVNSGITGFGSLNAIGTFASATVVAGYNLRTQSVANYSGAGSNGPVNVRAPSYAAPSEESSLVRGLPSIGNTANTIVRLGGTSVAAPYAARLLFNALSAGSAPPHGETPASDSRTGTGLVR